MKTNLSRHELWKLCVTNDWFTCGSIKQYDRLFYANENGASLDEIITIIWLCSDVERRNDIKLKIETYLEDKEQL